jgi:hypothetical protein
MSADKRVTASAHGEILVDHGQFMLDDCDFGEADLDLLYHKEAFARCLGVSPGVFAIFTVSH